MENMRTRFIQQRASGNTHVCRYVYWEASQTSNVRRQTVLVCVVLRIEFFVRSENRKNKQIHLKVNIVLFELILCSFCGKIQTKFRELFWILCVAYKCVVFFCHFSSVPIGLVIEVAQSQSKQSFHRVFFRFGCAQKKRTDIRR